MRIFLSRLIHDFGIRRNILAGLVGLVVGGCFGFGLIMWANRNATVVVREAQEVDGVASLSGHIDLFFDIDRVRDCPSETSRWLWTWVEHGGERIKQFYPLVNTATTLTEIGRGQRFILTIPIPPGIWPGQWYYWSKTTEHCPFLPNLLQSRIHESTDIPIEILDKAP